MSGQSDKDISFTTGTIKRYLSSSSTWRGEPSNDLGTALEYMLWWRGDQVIEQYPKVLIPPSADEERIGPVCYGDKPLWLSKTHARFLIR